MYKISTTRAELSKLKDKELKLLIKQTKDISKEIEESEAEISKLQEKVERLKNEQLNIALTELEKDELIRKAAKFYDDLWDVLDSKQIKDLDNCNEMINAFDYFEHHIKSRLRRYTK